MGGELSGCFDLNSGCCQSKKNRTDPPFPQRLEIAESETVVAKTELHLALKRIEDFQVSDASKFFIEESSITTCIYIQIIILPKSFIFVQMAISSDMDSDSGGSTLQYRSDEVIS